MFWADTRIASTLALLREATRRHHWQLDPGGGAVARPSDVIECSKTRGRLQRNNVQSCRALTRTSDGRPSRLRTVSDPTLSLCICESRREFRAPQCRFQSDVFNPSVHH